MLLAYIYRSITHRVHFLDKASRDLFICAKDLFVAAKEETPATRGYVAGRGKLKQSRLRVEFGLFRSARHRAERFSSGVVAVRETCSFAPKTCSLKPWRPTHMGRCLQDQHSKAVARRLTAMPEVLPVQFMRNHPVKAAAGHAAEPSGFFLAKRDRAALRRFAMRPRAYLIGSTSNVSGS